MRVFVTGATGFIGSAIVQELLGAGHQVLGLVRSEASAQALTAAGAEPHHGSLEDVDSLRRGAAAADGVIHTAFIHDFSKKEACAEIDRRAIEVLGEALAGSHRPLVVTSALGLLAAGRVATEDAVADPHSPGGHRVPSEQAALALASRGVRVSVIRLPPSVHGTGDYGFVPGLIRIAREKGRSAYIGEGSNHWSAVHRVDVAALYRLALEKAPAGSVLHGVAEQGVTTRDLANVIGRHLNVPVASISPEAAPAQFTWLTRFFALDMSASSTKTRAQLGWQPRQPGLLADLEQGHYFAT